LKTRTWIPALALGLLELGGTTPAGAQDFSYLLDGVPDEIAGAPSSTRDFRVGLVLQSSNIPDGTPGPQGWSLGVRNRGVRINGITVAGTVAADVNAKPPGRRSTGFEVSQLVDPAREPTSGALAGLGPQGEGAVSAIVLSFIMPITLDPNSRDTIAFVDYTATVGDVESSATIAFVSGLQGLGQPVGNDITQQGATVSPSLDSKTFSIKPPPPPESNCTDGVDNDDDGETDCDDDDCSGAAECAGGTDLKIGTASDPDADSVELCTDDEGATVAVTAYIGPNDPADVPASGAQGWSLGIEHTPDDLELVSASTRRTVAGDVNDGAPGIRNTGFEVTEIINPARQNPVGREGLVSAVVLSFVMPITLDPAIDSSILIATYRAETAAAGEGFSSRVAFADGLVGSGQPVQTVLTIQGATVSPTSRLGITLVHGACVEIPRFLRGDANNDGRVNIADPIYTINERVRQGPPFGCDKAADANDDGMVDLSDAMYTILYQFRGGPRPLAPFVERPARGAQCGDEPPESVDDGLSCDDANCG